MNIGHIREVQNSILDESRPFDMGYWGDCIAGHAYRCATGHKVEECDIPLVVPTALAYLELSTDETQNLFRRNCDRAGAVETLESLINRAIEPATSRVRFSMLWAEYSSSRDRLALARPRSEAISEAVSEEWFPVGFAVGPLIPWEEILVAVPEPEPEPELVGA